MLARLRTREAVWSAGGLVGLLVLALTLASFERVRLTDRPARQPDIVPQQKVPVMRLGAPDLPESGPAAVETAGEPPALTALSAFGDRPLGEIRRLSPVIVLRPPFEPVDSLQFQHGAHIFRLADVEGPHEHAVCEDEHKALWACGRRGRVALYDAIRGGELVCTIVASGGRGAADLVKCRAGRRGDVALDLIRAGWLRPVGLAERMSLAAQEEARQAQRGLWNGGWKLLR